MRSTIYNELANIYANHLLYKGEEISKDDFEKDMNCYLGKDQEYSKFYNEFREKMKDVNDQYMCDHNGLSISKKDWEEYFEYFLDKFFDNSNYEDMIEEIEE